MSAKTRVNLARRSFLKAGVEAGAGLTLGVILPPLAAAQDAAPGLPGSGALVAGRFEPNAFVTIAPDNTVTVISKHLEMGQGVYTGLATLVAEELDADWDQVAVSAAPADASRYNNLFWGPMQGTGGSTAIANSFMQMREAGAAARQMLIAAAAERWSVAAGEITVASGVVRHASSGRSASFGELAEAAARQPVPTAVTVKDPADFRLIGKRVPRKDGSGKIDGSAVFTQDVQLDGMLTSLVAHPPRFGARVNKVDSAAARAVPGVVAVHQIPSGVAVVARDFWSASRGRDALQIDWDESGAVTASSATLMASYRERAQSAGLVARSEGAVDTALEKAANRLDASYEFPYLAHAAMEPMNCVIRLDEQGCEVWNGEQLHTGDQMALAGFLGITPQQVRVNMLFAGGSFGRRANPQSDYLLEAAAIAKASGAKAPVKLVWTREDDMRAGWFRPMYFHSLRAGLDAQGRPVAWQHRIVGQSIGAGTAFESAMVRDGVDSTSVEGASNLPYAIPNVSVELHTTEVGVPVQWWRAVGSTHTAFAVECFIDELAHAAGRDPVEYRLELLGEHPRHSAVLQLAAERAGWGKPLGEGKARGVALHESFNTRVAQVAELSRMPNGGFQIDRVVIAVDCGIAINPDVIRAQMEGGMGYGLSATLESEITIENGAVVEGNFDGYRVLRIGQMPKVEVHIVKSAEPPTGVGEPATPVIAPAVANALFALDGKRARRLPLGVNS